MDTKAIGKFLKELRNEKRLTQEQLAEYIHVSNRTVSRWETGANLPDIAILIELADFYDVDIRDMLDGERKNQKMEKEGKETLLKVAEYNQEESKRLILGGRVLFILGFIISLVNLIIEKLNPMGKGFWHNLADFIQGLNDGLMMGVMLIGILYTSSRLKEFKKTKKRIVKKF